MHTVRGLHVVLAAADDAHSRAERRAQHVVPLAHEIERGREDDGAAPPILDGQAGEPGLARARRQDDDAAALVRAPGLESLGLIRPRLAAHARARRQLVVAARPILDVEGRAREGPPYGRVGDGGRAVASRARIPHALRRRRGRRGGKAPQLQCPAREGQREGHGASLDHHARAWARRGPVSRSSRGSAAGRSRRSRPGPRRRRDKGPRGRPPPSRRRSARVDRRARAAAARRTT